jgi:hypothetical protein
MEITPPLCIMTGAICYKLYQAHCRRAHWSSKAQVIKKLHRLVTGSRIIALIMGFICLAVVSQAIYFEDPDRYYFKNPRKHPSLDTVYAIGAYIEARTSQDEAIFAWPIYGFASHRYVIFNITHPLFYDKFYGEHELALKSIGYPTTQEIMNYLEEHKVRYIVIDSYMEDFYFDYRDWFENYIRYHYQEVEEINGVGIYLRIDT